ncbi:AAA family ATPase [Aneurinibacillus sp. BA2021]|nr:AAA family ATPase [Aneurinibacillus sp. BA2021]
MNHSFTMGKRNKTIRIALFDRDSAYIADTTEYFHEHPEVGIEIVHSAERLTSDGQDVLIELAVDAVLIGIDAMENPEVSLDELLAGNCRKIILLFDSLNDSRMELFAAKQIDLLYKHASPIQFITAIHSLPKQYRKDLAQVEVDTEQLREKGVIYTVYSPKGGTGKTTIAANMALYYAQKGIKTLLIDLSMFGSVAPMLKVPVKGQGLSSVITALELDRTLQQNDKLLSAILDNIVIVTQDKEEELHILPAASPVKMEKLSLEDMAAILRQVRVHYDVVIIDTSSELSERNIAAFTEATKILLIATPDIIAGWNLLQIKDFFHKLMLPKEKVNLIFNKSSKYVEFNNHELAALLDYPVIAEIPDNYRQIQGYMNKGLPVAYKEWLSVNYDLKKLAHLLYPVFTPKELKKPSAIRSFFIE